MIIHNQVMGVEFVPPPADYFSLEYSGPSVTEMSDNSLYNALKRERSVTEESILLDLD